MHSSAAGFILSTALLALSGDASRPTAADLHTDINENKGLARHGEAEVEVQRQLEGRSHVLEKDNDSTVVSHVAHDAVPVETEIGEHVLEKNSTSRSPSATNIFTHHVNAREHLSNRPLNNARLVTEGSSLPKALPSTGSYLIPPHLVYTIPSTLSALLETNATIMRLREKYEETASGSHLIKCIAEAMAWILAQAITALIIMKLHWDIRGGSKVGPMSVFCMVACCPVGCMVWKYPIDAEEIVGEAVAGAAGQRNVISAQPVRQTSGGARSAYRADIKEEADEAFDTNIRTLSLAARADKRRAPEAKQ